jgi:hypothetical protein
VNQYAFPMADRMVRHRVLGWAADTCEARGWKMRIFGRGWEKHERLGALAGPELAHGEELRAAYATAGITVHASIHWMYHQRVMECALSGGLPAVYLKPDDVSLLRAWTLTKMWELEPKPGIHAAGDCPEAMGLVAQLQRTGRPVHSAWAALDMTERMIETARRAWGGMPEDPAAAMLLGDFSETTFASRADLERLIGRATESNARRQNLSRGIAGRVRECYSTEKAAAGILALVRQAVTAN